MPNLDRKNLIQEIADSYVNRSLFSGIEWVAEKSGKIVLSGKSGYQNFEQKKSIPENAIYRIYSMTKPITSVMALKLIERGKLRLYDPVSSFIPSFEKLKVMNPDGSLEELNRPMIIEDLLTHRSGFTYDFLMGCHVAPLYSERDISDNGKKSLEEKCEILSELPLAYQPGSRFNYSVSLDVLARVIEIVNEKDFGDTLKSAPLLKMHTLGSDFMPSPTHVGGLRYHGMSPMLSHLVHNGHMEPRAYGQKECLEAGIQFARTEGIMPAPEATHAIKGAVDEALKCKAEGKSKAILFNLCGHGHFDMQAYMDYFSGNLAEDKFDAEAFEESMASIPAVN